MVVSSGGVSRPDSAVYKFLNLFGRVSSYGFAGVLQRNLSPSMRRSCVGPRGHLHPCPSAFSIAVDTFSGQIMFWKIKGEDEMRAMYAAARKVR